MATASSGWASATWAVVVREFRGELRSRVALSAILLFAITALTVVSFSVGQYAITPAIGAALLWVVLFFAAMTGLAHTFVKEVEAGTDVALRLVGAATGVYLGKLGFNWILFIILQIVISPLFILFMNQDVQQPILYIITMLFAGFGLSVAATTIAAIIAQGSFKSALFPILAFPILLPLLIVTIKVTRLALTSVTFVLPPEMGFIVAYDGILLVVSLLLFEYVWE